MTSTDETVTLSNGQRLWVGKEVDDFAQWELEYCERFISAGHRLGENDEGEVDRFFTSGGFCNGIGCSECRVSPCMHCAPNYQPEPCSHAAQVNP